MNKQLKAMLAATLLSMALGTSVEAGDTPYELLDRGDGLAIGPYQVPHASSASAAVVITDALSSAYAAYVKAQAINARAAQQVEVAWQELKRELEKSGLFE